jgi:hypothetical protein
VRDVRRQPDLGLVAAMGQEPPGDQAAEVGGNMGDMSNDEIEAEALKLDPSARARLAKRLLESLETLSDQENGRLWAEEAERRDAEWDSASDRSLQVADVLRDARAKLK